MEEPRILVVGRTIPEVASAEWDSPVLPNATDFTVALLDLSTIPSAPQKLTQQGVLEFVALLKRLIASGGHVIALLPRPRIFMMKVSASKPAESKIRLQNFLPVSTVFSTEHGETIQDIHSDFRWYLERLKAWDYHFTINAQLETERGNFTGTIVPLAKNREGMNLAVRVQYPKKGSITILPVTPNIDSLAAIERTVRELLGPSRQALPPTWSQALDIPGHADLSTKIDKTVSQISALEKLRSESVAERVRLEEWRGLVYSTGKQLEGLVARAFAALGATILPDKIGNEEFLLNLNGTECICEVKGVTGSATLTHLRQLIGHMLDAEQADGRKRKGILVAATWREIDPAQRTENDNPDFPPNVVAFAKNNHICLITGLSLFHTLTTVMRYPDSGPGALGKVLATSGAFLIDSVP